VATFTVRITFKSFFSFCWPCVRHRAGLISSRLIGIRVGRWRSAVTALVARWWA